MITLVLVMVTALSVYGFVRAAARLFPTEGWNQTDGYVWPDDGTCGSYSSTGTGRWEVPDNPGNRSCGVHIDFAGEEFHWNNTGWDCINGGQFRTTVDYSMELQGESKDFTYLEPGKHTFMMWTMGGGTCYIHEIRAYGRVATKRPTNPTFKNESHGLSSGTATRTVTVPSFSWNASTDPDWEIDHYNIYWGPDGGATSVTTTTTGTSYSPGSSADGTYYLRVQAVNAASIASFWVTMFQYVLDTTPPSTVGACSEGHTLGDNTWQNNQNAPNFSWSKPSLDAVSYLIYWGNSASGITATQILTESYVPTAPAAEGTDYLRLASQDSLGNTSSWTTCFTYKYDVSAPGNFGIATDSSGSINNVWEHTITNPHLSLAAPTEPLSGWNSTRTYWGSSATGTDNAATWSSTNPSAASPTVATTGTYYLRAQSQDNAGNSSTWQTVYTFKYDNVLPTANAVLNPAAGTWTNGNVVATVTGNDTDSGVAHVYCKLSADVTYTDGGVGPCTLTATANDVVSYYVQDIAGNNSAVQTITVTNIDRTAPGGVAASSGSELSGAVSGECRETSNTPTFTWTAPAVSAGESPITTYQYYFGTNPNGTDSTGVGGTSLTPAGTLNDGTHYYFRVAAVDAATNVGPWTTMFDWCYKKPKVQEAVQALVNFIYPPTPTLFPTPTLLPTPPLTPSATMPPAAKPAENQHQSAPVVAAHQPTAGVIEPTTQIPSTGGGGGKPLFIPIAMAMAGGGLILVFGVYTAYRRGHK